VSWRAVLEERRSHVLREVRILIPSIVRRKQIVREVVKQGITNGTVCEELVSSEGKGRKRHDRKQAGAGKRKQEKQQTGQKGRRPPLEARLSGDDSSSWCRGKRKLKSITIGCNNAKKHPLWTTTGVEG
jgi:hypothetical protein